MRAHRISLNLKKAPFPAVITIFSLVLFVAVYLFFTVFSTEPYYFQALLFAVPCLCFGVITYLTGAGKLKADVSTYLTVFLMLVLGAAAQFEFIWMSLEAATAATTDVGRYDRILRVTGYPDNTLIRHFPDKIPGNARNIVFRYNSACLQGGEEFGLRFETDEESLQKYTQEFSQKAKWVGKAAEPEAEKDGIFSTQFSSLGYSELPDDFTVYLIDSKPYQPDNWNHGRLSLAAVSGRRSEIIFLADNW